MAHDYDDALDAMHAWVLAASGLTPSQVVWGQQDAERPKSPAITMRISNITELGASWVEYENNPLVFDDITVTADAATDALTAVAHGRLTGDGPVHVGATVTHPGGLAESTDYWVVRVDDDSFKLAESFADAMAAVPVVVDLTSAGAGVITVSDTENSVRAGEEMVAIARSLVRCTLELRGHADPIIGNDMAVLLLQRVRAKRELPSQQAIFEDANITLQDVERVRAIMGKRDDFLFEPCAVVDLHVTMAIEESEYLTIIERVQGTNQILDPDEDYEIPTPS